MSRTQPAGPSSTGSTLDAHSVHARLRELGIDPERSVAADATGTILAAHKGHISLSSTSSAAEVEESIAALPVIAGEATADLVVGSLLASGGMGQIRLAQQLSLGREVAVKCAVPNAKDHHEDARALLYEARVTGALEHPNIVPIHALGRTASGEVLFAMKRIEGQAWSTLLSARPELEHERERHLRILVDVCRAVEFAHANGVLHRDLKPGNVMVGPFGEVYLLDWGLAVCFGDADIAGVPHVRELCGLSGTPNFMAPEMAEEGAVLDERTDVYLLGGLLHVVLTGKSPHAIHGGIFGAMTAPPASRERRFAPEVQDELAHICRRALAWERADRPPSARAMREALEEFLHQAGARALLREGNRQLNALRAMLASDAADMDIHRAASTTRLSFELALREWPGSTDARTGLHKTIAELASRELRRGHLEAARLLVRELEPPIADLTTRLEQLEAARRSEEEEKSRLRSILREIDTRPGGAARARLSAIAALLWTPIAFGSAAMVRLGYFAPSHRSLGLGTAAMVVLLLAGSLWLRFRRGTRRVSAAYFDVMAAAAAANAFGWILLGRVETPMPVVFALAHLQIALGLFAIGVFAERAMVVPALVMGAGAPLILAWPDLQFEFNGVVVFATGMSAMWLSTWRASSAVSPLEATRSAAALTTDMHAPRNVDEPAVQDGRSG